MRTKIVTILLFLSAVSYAFAQESIPTLSIKHGICEKAFTLQISPSSEGREIRYTLNGDLPTMESNKYTAPLSISHTTVVRASEVLPDGTLSSASTATYIFLNDILTQANDANGNPITPQLYPSKWGPYASISGTAPAYYAMDSHIVEESKDNILKGFKSLPIVSIVTNRSHLFSSSKNEETGGIYIYTGAPVGSGIGRDWERPISFEIFGSSLDFTADCGTKIHGGHSRLPEKNPKHAFRIMFKSKYGPKKLYYPVFGKRGVDNFEDLVLRTFFGNAWTHWDEGNRVKAQYTRDLWARSVQERLGHPHSKGQPVHLFLNGMYWGMYNLCERINKEHCAENYGGKKGDYDVIKVEETEGEKIEAADGTLDAWNEMISVVERVGKGSKDAYYQLQGLDSKGQPNADIEPLLDLENFADYMLINFYGGNTDWDHHNWYAFRNSKNPTHGFRFICWDTELIFGNLSDNVTDNDNYGKPSHILKCLMKDEEFKNIFNHRAHVLLTDNGLLTEKGVREVWDSLFYVVRYALYDESARWGDYRRDIHPYTSQGHRYRVDSYYMDERKRLIKNYFTSRTDVVIQQLKAKGWYSVYDGINSIDAPTEITRPIYNLSGIRIGTTDDHGNFPTLPNGIYIVDGKKKVVK